MESLTFKLNSQQKLLKRTPINLSLLLSKSEIKQIAMHLPKDSSSLSSLIGPDKTTSYGDKILAITSTHPRDQDAFMECVLEMQAFVRGGDTGLHVLEPVYRRILAHYKMMAEINEIFDILSLCTHHLTGKIKRKYQKCAEEDADATYQWTPSKKNRLSQ